MKIHLQCNGCLSTFQVVLGCDLPNPCLTCAIPANYRLLRIETITEPASTDLHSGLPQNCTQCGSAYKICAHCGEKIIFVPKAGFGNLGDWQHIEPYSANRGGHIPHPVLHVT